MKGAPYTTNREELSSAQLEAIIQRSMKQSDRYTAMKHAGNSEAEIKKAFNTPVEMKVFSYDGPVDTVMTADGLDYVSETFPSCRIYVDGSGDRFM